MFELDFMRLAAVAGVSAGLALSVLGVYVVLKRVVFVGLTLANVATLGAAIALVLGLPLHASAAVAALAAAVALALAGRPRRLPAESVIGWGFAAAAAATVLVLARASSDTDALRLLFGNVLAITPREAWLLATVAGLVLLIHVLFARRFVLVVFDPEAAAAAGIWTTFWSLLLYATVGVATAAAVHEAGALLSFALMVLPAMAALLLTRRLAAAFATAALIAVGAVLLGLWLSFAWDLPTGPLTVVVLATIVPAAAAARGLRRSGRQPAGASRLRRRP